MTKFYIASGWFNENQEKDLNDIIAACKSAKVEYFSARDENLFSAKDEKSKATQVFDGNITGIASCSAVICNTRDKDMGSIFEAGVAYQMNVPIIYFARGLSGSFNLMLAESGIAVTTSIAQLLTVIQKFLENPEYKEKYLGEQE